MQRKRDSPYRRGISDALLVPAPSVTHWEIGNLKGVISRNQTYIKVDLIHDLD